MHIPDVIYLNPNRVWRTYTGGKILDELEGIKDSKDSNFPEDWIGSTTRAQNTGRENFKDEGLSLVNIYGENILFLDLILQFPAEIVGLSHFKKYGANTQFLIKYLDSSIRLHLQCHPTMRFAKKYLKSNNGKTETYIVLKHREDIKDPYIYLGFQNPPAKEDFRKAILNQNIPDILSCFQKIPVNSGDVIFIPGGLPHAIGEGVFFIEIMEPTDYAVRIEFERGGFILPEAARFMGRDIDFAVSMFNYVKMPKERIKEKYFLKPKLLNSFGDKCFEYSLINSSITKCFSVKKICINNSILRYKENSFYIGIVIKGSGCIINNETKFEVKAGDKFFVPYKTKDLTYMSNSEFEVIISLPPL